MNPTEPVLKQALGSQWSSLALVLQAHYGLTPFTDDQIHLKGNMDRLSHSPVVSPLLPLAALAGAMVPYRGNNVPVEVVNYSVREKPSYFWHRTFFFPGKKPFVFQSSMQCTGEGEPTEYVRFGLGIRFSITVKNGGLVENELGYLWRIGKRSIPIPISVMLGRSYVEEMPVSDLEYEMQWTEGRRMTPEVAIASFAPARPPAVSLPVGLTIREVEVLRLLSAGLTNAQIASLLIVSPTTVNAQLRNIYNKLDVTSRSAATRFAIDHGLA
jgi:DNA-binding CsgD family transcriptional regulator